LRDFLGSFRFVGAMVGQTVGTMSGGEKARLVLAMVVYQRPNLLLLDEPTNHLDLTTREALAMALNAFSGTVMLVSHDRALLRSVCDDFWLVAKGGITEFEGDLDDYQVYLLDQAKQQREAANKAANKAAKQAISNAAAPVIATPAPVVKAAVPATQDDGDSRVNQGEKRRELAAKRQAIASQTKPFQQQITAAETNMAKLELERDALNRELLALPSADKLADIGRRLKGIDDELAGAETKWLEASQAIEALTEQA
jgi:ATP-binding cassette subfamily F protein 3